MTRFYAVIVSQKHGQEAEANDSTLVAPSHVQALRQLANALDTDPELELLSISIVSERKANTLQRPGNN